MRIALASLLFLGLTASADAQTNSTAVTITMVRTGWNADSFAIVTTGPMVNPAHCATPDGYISEASKPGYKTYYSAALAAFTTNMPLIVAVHNTECYAGRPVIIGLNLVRG